MNLIALSEDFVKNFIKDKLSNSYKYHNLNHTLTVVNAVKELMDSELFDEKDKQALLIAAWFHDTGYIESPKNHEDKSIEIVKNFLTNQNCNSEFITQVVALIDVTKFNHVPKNKLQQVIKDADYFHFSTKEYIETSELLREEWKLTLNKSYTDLEWLQTNLDMLTNCHHFYSEYALANWQPKKEKNSARLAKKIKKMQENMKDDINKVTRKKEKEERPEKSIDTMFKITLTNHIRLSEIADSKANILLSVNAIIISIALSTLIPKLDSPSNAHLIFPTFLMVFFSVISIIFAILSTKPKVTSGKFTRQDIEDKKVNLLFFGNFFKMPYEEFEWAMNEMIKDKNYLNNSMIKDLYHLGLVLERKYRLLRITYNIFMVGIIVSVVAFVLAFRAVGA
ncbi:Pycsar system effector family protein [Flavobacterium sp.]|uniref:Pycsar system effector family protein n=1 Tax=Flavobacterium sp. TaxID=239 RepID=UPI00375182A7